MGKLGPYLAVIEFLMRFRVWFCGLGWEIVLLTNGVVSVSSHAL